MFDTNWAVSNDVGILATIKFATFDVSYLCMKIAGIPVTTKADSEESPTPARWPPPHSQRAFPVVRIGYLKRSSEVPREQKTGFAPQMTYAKLDRALGAEGRI